MLGAPGAGKGTQSALLAEKIGAHHISTGELFRSAIAEGTDIGKKVKEYVDRGDLVPDKLVVDVVTEKLKSFTAEESFILDGFPRTIEQARALDKFLEERQTPLTHIVYIDVPNDKLLERLRIRIEQSGSQARSDDSEEVFAHRLKVYWEETAPLIEFYKEKGVLFSVDGLGTPEEVSKRVLEVLK
ncbi:MAG: adenylate kinase [Candidatus Dadabacteria bacterium]|nr:MAG: adenylate kinase [Candidatus Dadabacteria bacterium]